MRRSVKNAMRHNRVAQRLRWSGEKDNPLRKKPVSERQMAEVQALKGTYISNGQLTLLEKRGYIVTLVNNYRHEGLIRVVRVEHPAGVRQ